MKTAVVGSRSILDAEKIETLLGSLAISHVVSGGAKGVDSIAENYARKNNLPVTIFKPDWKRFGRGAGMIRNRDIVLESQQVLAFWDGSSKGTLNSINLAIKHGKILKVWIVVDGEYRLMEEECELRKLQKG